MSVLSLQDDFKKSTMLIKKFTFVYFCALEISPLSNFMFLLKKVFKCLTLTISWMQKFYVNLTKF